MTDTIKTKFGHGGKRPGAGRPKGSGKKPGEEDVYATLNRAKLKHERAKGNLAELKYKELASQLIPEEIHARELAAAYEVLAAGLATLPERLARECDLDAGVLAVVEDAVAHWREDLRRRLVGDT